MIAYCVMTTKVFFKSQGQRMCKFMVKLHWWGWGGGGGGGGDIHIVIIVT